VLEIGTVQAYATVQRGRGLDVKRQCKESDTNDFPAQTKPPHEPSAQLSIDTAIPFAAGFRSHCASSITISIEVATTTTQSLRPKELTGCLSGWEKGLVCGLFSDGPKSGWKWGLLFYNWDSSKMILTGLGTNKTVDWVLQQLKLQIFRCFPFQLLRFEA
jgi:hypothetical protein